MMAGIRSNRRHDGGSLRGHSGAMVSEATRERMEGRLEWQWRPFAASDHTLRVLLAVDIRSISSVLLGGSIDTSMVLLDTILRVGSNSSMFKRGDY